MNCRFTNAFSSLNLNTNACWRLLVVTFALLLPLAAVAQQSSAIHEAATAGDTEQLGKILDADGEAWKLADKAGNQALHLAAWNGHAEAVKLLLDCGAEVGARGFDEMTALHFAASKDHAVVCQLLLENGADREALNGVSRTPLQMAGQASRRVIGKFQVSVAGAETFFGAAQASRLDEVQRLLTKQPKLLDARVQRLTALMAAARDNRLDVMRLLIEKGADVDLLSDSDDPELRGASALSLACGAGHPQAVRLLLTHGAEVNPVDVEAGATAAIPARQPLQSAISIGGLTIPRELSPKVIADLDIDIELLASFLQSGGEGENKDVVLRQLVRALHETFLECRIRLSAEANEAKRKVIALLLDAGADPDRLTSSGTPLGLAIVSGDAEVVRRLLEAGADPNTETSSVLVRGPLVLAILVEGVDKGLGEISRAVLESGADPLADSSGADAFQIAASFAEVSVFRHLLAELDPDALSREEQGTLLVSIALQAAWLREALDAGFHVNAQSGDMQNTALHRALSNLEAVRVLLDAGADPNLADWAGFTPLHNAAEDGYPESIPLLLDHGAELEARTKIDDTPLSIAVLSDDAKALEQLLEAGANPDVENKRGETPLEIAATNGCLETVELLVEAGALIDRLDGGAGGRALMYAAGGAGHFNYLRTSDETPEAYTRPHEKKESNEPYLEVVEFLLARGADVNFRGKNMGMTVLHMAARFCTIDMVELLLDHGADLEVTPLESRNTPLRAAIAGANLETFKLLIERGANVKTRGDSGFTPLIAAAGFNQKEMIEILLAAGADIEAGNQFGVTPLFQAVVSRSDEAIRCLLEHGANVEAAAGDGKTPIDIATERGDQSLVRLLNRHRK
jgi:cytohesin